MRRWSSSRQQQCSSAWRSVRVVRWPWPDRLSTRRKRPLQWRRRWIAPASDSVPHSVSSCGLWLPNSRPRLQKRPSCASDGRTRSISVHLSRPRSACVRPSHTSEAQVRRSATELQIAPFSTTECSAWHAAAARSRLARSRRATMIDTTSVGRSSSAGASAPELSSDASARVGVGARLVALVARLAASMSGRGRKSTPARHLRRAVQGARAAAPF